MLIYKAWLETRWRFWAALGLLIAISFYTVLRAPHIIQAREQFHPGEQLLYAQYIFILLYKGYLQTLWIIAAVMLGLGGLWREKAAGVAGFTLSLPVSRRRLVVVRAAVGAAEAAVLAVVPSLLLWGISPLSGNSYPFSNAFLHAVLLVGGGLIFYVWGVLVSHLMQGEFSTPAVGLSVCPVLFLVFHLLQLKIYNPFDLMSGRHYLDPHTFLLGDTLPWAPLGFLTGISCLIVLAIARMIDSRDF